MGRNNNIDRNHHNTIDAVVKNNDNDYENRQEYAIAVMVPMKGH